MVRNVTCEHPKIRSLGRQVSKAGTREIAVDSVKPLGAGDDKVPRRANKSLKPAER